METVEWMALDSTRSALESECIEYWRSLSKVSRLPGPSVSWRKPRVDAKARSSFEGRCLLFLLEKLRERLVLKHYI